MSDFFKTIRGVNLAEILIREIPKIAFELKRMNDLKEQEFDLKIISCTEGGKLIGADKKTW